MSETPSIRLSRRLLMMLGLFALWTALAGGIVQILLGSTIIGSLFILVGLAVFMMIAEGTVPRRLEGRRIPKANLYLLLPILLIIAGNEVFGVLSSAGSDRPSYWAQSAYAAVLLLLTIVLIWQFVSAMRSQ